MPPAILVLTLGFGMAMSPVVDSREQAQSAEEPTCGQELAASAEVPERWQELMNHVATNMEWHAGWVGSASIPAKREHDGLLRVAGEYRAMATAAGRAATSMKALHDLSVAPHDPSKIARAAQAHWMRAKIRMQREFAALLLRHADESEKALAQMEASTGR